MELSEVKKVVDELGAAWKAFQDVHAQEQSEIKRLGSATTETKDKMGKIQATLDEAGDRKAAFDKGVSDIKALSTAVEGQKSAMDKLVADLKSGAARLDDFEKKLNRPGRGGGRDEKELTPDEAEHKKLFDAWLCKGDDRGVKDAERKAMSVGSDVDGGFLVPKDMTGRIVTRVFDTSPMRQLASVVAISTDALEGLRDTDEASAGWVGETAARPETTAPQLGSWRIPTHEQYANPRVSQKLLDDSALDVETWLGGKIADKLARLEATAFVVGTGVTQPRGFATYATAATPDASRAWGQFEHVATGTSADFDATKPADALFDLVSAFKPFYLNAAVWATRRSVIAKVRKFKDTTNQYLWQPSLVVGVPSTLMGYPISMMEDMPAIAASSLSLALGNFKEGYQIVDRAGIRMLRDPYTAKPHVQFYSTRRVGGDAIQFESIKFIKFI